ncbi:MAG: radical SAM protein [Methanoregulaceae archaeon]|nr:radical SAM protein [Methanoregulaceae archaeon]
MSADAFILDGYVDEPACLGVPPYISPYIRAVAGVLLHHGNVVHYLTIDQLRRDPGLLTTVNKARIVVMIAGVTVPGKYLGGTPANITEIQQIGLSLPGPATLLAGPIGFGYSPGGGVKAVKQEVSGFSHLLPGSPAESLESFLDGGVPTGEPDYTRSDEWSIEGSSVIRLHPSYPHVMCELETGRGCPRSTVGGCSFCTEPLYGPPRYRTIDAISREVSALSAQGARHFRVGRQPDLLAYGSAGGEFPVPRPELIGELFAGIREAAGDLLTLHIDNVNPGTIAHHEEASREALRTIIRYHTPGDVAAFGMETADPVVVHENNLKAGPDDVLRAVRVVNEVGGIRREGIPELLPGLNFVIGLTGETSDTFTRNMAFLREVVREGLLLRRINIRQLMPFEGTPAYERNTLGLHDTEFRKFKESVRKEIDLPMLRRIFPTGTRLLRVIIEETGALSFGRQMGSYPILVGVPLRLDPGTVLDVVVVDHGMRSLTALPVPIRINHLPQSVLKWIPGISRNEMVRLLAKRPFSSLEELRSRVGETPLEKLYTFS